MNFTENFRFWFFCDVPRRRQLVIDFMGQPVEPILKVGAVQEKSAGPSRMETTGCPETSVTNSQSTLPNISEEPRYFFTLQRKTEIKALAGYFVHSDRFY